MRSILATSALILAALFLFAFFRPSSHQIALTFDDLPVHGNLPPGETRLQVIQSLVTTLNAEHLPPTYGFINGRAVDKDPTLLAALEAWRSAGHPLGNHTWSHPALSAITPAQFEDDAARNEPLLQSLMPNEDWHYLRYPYLDEGNTPTKHAAVRAWLTQNHYQVADVTQSFGDYLWNPPYARCVIQQNQPAIATLERTYLAAAELALTRAQTVSRLRYARDIPFVVLLHVGSFDARMLPSLIALYRRHGLTFVTLQQAQGDPAYRGDPAAVLSQGTAILRHLTSLRDRVLPPKPPTDLARLCSTSP